MPNHNPPATVSDNAPATVDPMTIIVRSFYDLQALRLQVGGRISTNFKARLGQVGGVPEEEAITDEEDVAVLDEIRSSYTLISKGIAERVVAEAATRGEKPKLRRGALADMPTREQFNAHIAALLGMNKDKLPLITSFVEFSLVHRFLELHKAEQQQLKLLEEVLEESPLYTGYLKDIKGVGPAMAGILLAEIDLTKAKYASSLWAYAGYDVAPDGRGRSRRKEHLREVQYRDKNNELKTKVGITYNPTLKTKLYVLATCLLRSSNEKYKEIYVNYKNRMENHERFGVRNDGKKDEEGQFITSKARRHAQSIRYVIKRFLADYYENGRPILGLPVHRPYHEAKLGMAPHGKAS